jgi:predicted secreted protein
MEWTSVLAIFALIWVASAFFTLPFGVKTADDLGEPQVLGQAESAPVSFHPGKHAFRATIIATILTALYVVNYVNGWVEIEDINFFPEPPSGKSI